MAILLLLYSRYIYIEKEREIERKRETVVIVSVTASFDLYRIIFHYGDSPATLVVPKYRIRLTGPGNIYAVRVRINGLNGQPSPKTVKLRPSIRMYTRIFVYVIYSIFIYNSRCSRNTTRKYENVGKIDCRSFVIITSR